MNRKLLLGIILIPIALIIGTILIISSSKRYNKYVLNDSSWNKIISERTSNNNLKINDLKFNDYNLIIDESTSTIYYSVVDTSQKYNPIIAFLDNNINVAFNSKIDDSLVETNYIKLVIYNDYSYHIYTLIVTNYPILSFNYKEDEKITGKRISVDFILFDNHKNAINHYTKSDGKLISLDNGDKYIFSLTKESVGHNKRNNNISILGMNQYHEYILTKNNSDYQNRYVRLFINNQYIGIYTIKENNERSDFKYEPNK